MKYFETLILLPLLIITMLTSFCSCSENNAGHLDYEKLNNNLKATINEHTLENDSLYRILIKKLQSPEKKEVALYWVPRGQYSKFKSAEVYKIIEADTLNITGNASFDSLYEALDLYKKKILSIDPEITNVIKSKAYFLTFYFDSLKKNITPNLGVYFANKTNEEKLYAINKALDKVKFIENQILIHCIFKIDE